VNTTVLKAPRQVRSVMFAAWDKYAGIKGNNLQCRERGNRGIELLRGGLRA